MSRLFYHVMQDNVGNLLFDVSGTMRVAGTSTVATIYGDEALTVILPNPMTNHPSFGSFKCFLPVGDYDFYMAKAGYNFETLTGIQGYGTMAQQDSHDVHITGGTANFGPNASPAPHMLSVNGSSFLGETGIGQVSDTSTWLRVGSVLPSPLMVSKANKVGIGAVPDPAYILNVGPGNVALAGPVAIGRLVDPAYSLVAASGIATDTNLVAFTHLAVGTAPITNQRATIYFPKNTEFGLTIRPTDNDTGVGSPVIFQNTGNVTIGSISTTASATSFNTSSDARLKHAIAPLTGALGVVRSLRPITHLWRSDDSRSVGFLAHEVAAIVDGVVTGEKDAVDDEGRIVPQMIDYSKLVPWLVGACQALAAQVDALAARLDAAGA